MEVVRDGVVDHLARCLAIMPDQQAAALIAIESLGHWSSYLGGLWTRDCLSNHEWRYWRMDARIALCTVSLTCLTNKQRPSSPSNPWGRERATSEELWTRSCPSKHVQGQTTGRRGRTRSSLSYRERRRHTLFSRKGARIVS